MTPRVLAIAVLALAAACHEDAALFDGGGSPYMVDGGGWICPTNVGQALPCQCDDGTDNDGDGLGDLDDPDCFDGSDNTEGTSPVGGTQCTDGIDNDGDGAIDSVDAECTGPLDDVEGSFATGIPGDNMDACRQDCWFDGDSGSGNDRCLWDLSCDPVAGPAYGCGTMTGGRCDQPQNPRCIDFCLAFTPNGCDCFGCCDVYVDGVPYVVVLNAQCTTDVIDDPARCVPCTKVASCDNPCDPCEYCLGRPPTMECVPPDGGPGYTCPDGQVACDPDGNTCEAGYWCLTGCCAPNID
jgi:hypothetical protein